MTSKSPTSLDAKRAADVLERALGASRPIDLTIADAAAKSGLPLRDAERGLHALVSEYRGHLRVTEDGDLLFRFPDGLSKPWETRTKIAELLATAQRVLGGAARFVVRAWIAVVLIGYVAMFLALLVALAVARSSSSSREDRGGFGLGFILFRIVADALFWTFHPFSPVALAYEPGWARPARARAAEPKEPFYEKVNRFFFGPTETPPDPRATERAILAEIRAQKGRIGLADVMRVTGLSRDEADPLMSRLMLDYGGEVEVSDQGSLVYRFADLRRTLADPRTPASRPRPVWASLERLAPLTGNGGGTNALIIALNGFNLIMSLWVMAQGLTISKIGLLLSGVPWQELPLGGTPIALGLVPLLFSIALFALPLGRALWRPIKAKRVARENGRRAVLRAVLEELDQDGVTEQKLRDAWRNAAGAEVDEKELNRQVVALGGDVDVEAGAEPRAGVRFRFPELEAEAQALEAEREAASEQEVRVGPVIFTSESEPDKLAR